jgi:hypothetical protein
MAMGPPPNLFFEESRARERIDARARTLEKFSEGSVLIALALVLLIIIGSIFLFYALH